MELTHILQNYDLPETVLGAVRYGQGHINDTKLMTLECGIRFLTDYLEGDHYFHTQYPEHNLDRCRTQFKLVSDMEAQFPQMKKIAAEYL